MRQISAVAVFAGARDEYQLVRALYEADCLSAFITNAYSRRHALLKYGVDLSEAPIRIAYPALAAFGLMRILPTLDLRHFSDRVLSRKARDVAYRNEAALFAYSYYAFEAFKPGPKHSPYRFLFQLHPHPEVVRRILLEELDLVPAAAASLQNEAEIALPSRAFSELCVEPSLANGWVTASGFTAQTLSLAGIDRAHIHVVPYGLDFDRFPARATSTAADRSFTIMFLGSLIQRKGLSYLLDAVRKLNTRHIRVLLRGRGYVDQQLLAQYRDLSLDIQVGLPTSRIVADLQASDMFVFPSLVEGFGHVILQAMGCGLPVVTTAHTCGPDVITEGADGFVVPIRDSEAIAARIQWGIEHRGELAHMGQLAAHKARNFTWARFRDGIVGAYRAMLNSVEDSNG